MSDSPLPYIESKILRVNLTEQKVTKEAIPEDLYRNYLGGRGLGVKILYDNLSPNVDALSADTEVSPQFFLRRVTEVVLPRVAKEKGISQLSPK